jgi:hypothetical protein
MRPIVLWLIIILAIIIGAILFIRQDIPLTLSTDQNAGGITALDRWEKMSGIAQNIVTIIAIILGGFWTYFTFIKGRTLKEQLEPKVGAQVIKRNDQKFLVATLQLKNTGKSKINFKRKGTRLIVFKYQPSADSTAVTEKDWELYYAAPPILVDHRGIEPNEQIQEPVLIPLEQDDQQIYMIRLRINSKKTTWTVDTITDGNPAKDNLSTQKPH